MQRGIARKWRPSLALVLGCTIAVVLCLPVAGIVAVRYLYPLTGYREAVLLISICVVIIAACVGWVLWRILLRPIRTLAHHADHIRTGQGGDGPLPHYGTREMRALGQAMLDMGETLQNREAVMRTFADHVTHELKSPLTVIRGSSELLGDDTLPAAERARLLARLDQAVLRMSALLDAQRALAKAREPIAAGTCRLADLALPALAKIAADAEMPLPESTLGPVVDHLVGNAREHGATCVTLTATAGSLRIADNGPGISPGNRARIFDPYFTTRRDSGGTGMGLPIVQRLLESQGATIALDDVAGEGAVFVIAFA